MDHLNTEEEKKAVKPVVAAADCYESDNRDILHDKNSNIADPS